jgi:glycosyltransferase involved in cell wall biosynthesis
MKMRSGSKIKLVQIIADGDLSGGPTHVLGLLSHLDKDKFETYLICPRGVLFDRANKIAGVKVIPLAMKSKFDFRALSNLKKLLESIQTEKDPFGPMIVHTHSTRAGLLGRLATPKGVFSVYTEHRWDKDYHLENRLNEWLQKTILGYLNRRTNLIIAVSSSVKDYLVGSKSASKDQIVVIPNGIDTHRNITPKGHRNLTGRRGHHQIKLGTVGNLNIQKGHKYLVEAMAEVVKHYPHIELQIVGDGEEKKSLKSQVLSLKLERNITLLGRRENPREIMGNWDIFVLSSVAETFGIVILEAISVGLPIVSTSIGGITDIIDKKSAILVPSRDPRAMAKGIIDLIEHPTRGAEMVRAGRERLKQFSWNKIIKDIEREYQALINR